jgi:hypothetical protein
MEPAHPTSQRPERAGIAGDTRALAGAFAILVVATAVRTLGLGHTPHFDELYHVMAAESLLQDGTLQLADGVPYVRGRLFTFLVAGSFAMFGEGLTAARLPALLAGALLCALVFLWVRRHHGPLAAWIAGLLVCFAPTSLYLSQQSRFYTLHALLVWTGAAAAYRLATDPAALRSIGTWAGLAASFWIAYTLQPTTLIAAAAVAAGAVAVSLPRWARRPRRAHALLLGVALVGGGAALFVVGPDLWERFRWAAPWGGHLRDEPRFYYSLFANQYPALWPTLPVLALAAAVRNRKAALFLAVTFVATLATMSLAAWKHERYIYFMLPFAFALAAMGVGQILSWLWSAFSDDWARLRLWHRVGVTAVATAALGFLLAAQDAVSYSYRMLTVSDAEWWLPWYYRGEPDWERAAPLLAADAPSDRVVMATSKLKALYYLGDLDYVVGREPLLTGAGLQPDFRREDQLGRPVVYSAAAFERIMACAPAGLVVIENASWRNSLRVDDSLAAFLETRTEPVPLPDELRLRAFRWQHATGRPGASGRAGGGSRATDDAGPSGDDSDDRCDPSAGA